MRIWFLWIITTALCLYAIKDWFNPVAFLIFLMPLYGNPDFPSSALGIQGMNPWNVLFFFILISYIIQRNKENALWDMDTKVSVLLIVYVSIIIISALRGVIDIHTLHDYGVMLSSGDIISENLINSIKFLFPAYLVFVGARTESRRKLILWAIIASHLYIALVVIRGIPISAVTDERALTRIGLKILQNTFSWSKVNTAMLLAGGAWAILFSMPYLAKRKQSQSTAITKLISAGLFAFTSFALALTGGRMGYAVWAILALLFSLLRWKKGLILIPILTAIVLTVLPSAEDRLLDGISTSSGEVVIENSYAMTSGRTDVWPVVLDRIGKSPWLGYGAQAMTRTGAKQEVEEKLSIGEGDRGFPHPHNAYLWLLLDTGILGATPILMFWGIVLHRSKKLCGTPESESDAIGITSLSLSLGLLIAGLGSQNFYPVHGEIAMWAAIALAFRLYIDQFHKTRLHQEHLALS